MTQDVRRQGGWGECAASARAGLQARGGLLIAAVAGAIAASPALAYHPKANVVRAIYVFARDVVPTAVWAPFHKPGRYVTDVAHSGQFSVMCQNPGGPGSACGVGQYVPINQTQPRPLKIAGWSRAEGVQADGKSWRYSLYVDFALADGTSWPMKVAAFDPGTHDWQYAETVVTPPKPVRAARFYAFIREIPGKVWFDDLFLGEPGGKNLLRCQGFEPKEREDRARRLEVFRRLKELGANGLHIYLSSSRPQWPTKLGPSPYTAGHSPLEGFLADARRAGFGVWTTPAPPQHPIASASDPNFPEYWCPNGRWGDEWVAIVADLARFDFAGISVVPDEYNYNNWRLRRRFAKHTDPKVAEFYRKMAAYCDCPACRRLFRARFGVELPDLHALRPTDPYRRYINFRYWTTTRWIRRAVEAVKRTNPDCLADSLICVTPVCSDNWWGPGVAWDMVGYRTGIDFLTTDPYIILHNYLGDSTHWYVTETALKLSGASPWRVCGVVLEPCRLRKQYRELDPVEVYGSALSAAFHGAREIFYFHWVHISGRSGVAADPQATQRNVAAAFGLLKAIDPWLEGARPWPGVAVLHSRASEDWWAFYSLGDEGRPALTLPSTDRRHGYLAQLEPLMALLRCGVPVDLFYLDSVRAEELQPYSVVLVPFPYAVPDGTAEMLERLAQQGKRVVIISQFGTLSEDGRLRQRPALLRLVGLRAAPRGQKSAPLDGLGGMGEKFAVYENVGPVSAVRVLARAGGTPVILKRRIGRGSVVFMAGRFGADLPRDYSNWHRARERRIYPPALRPGHLRVLLAALFGQNRPPDDWPHPSPLLVPAGGDDVEVAWMINGPGDLLVLAVNWRAEPTEARLSVPRRWAGGALNVRSVQAGGDVRAGPAAAVRWDGAGCLRLSLAAGQVTVVRIAAR